MNSIDNPFAPGAGAQPPALVGRDQILEESRVSLARLKKGRHSKSQILVGLRGVGKTVLLDRIRLEAESQGFHTVRMEAPEGRSLPAMLAPQLRTIVLKLSRLAQAKDLATNASKALSGFVSALRVKFQDLEVGLELDPELGLADSGDLETDLASLLESVGRAAKSADSGVALFIDELQYIDEKQLGALISALHRMSQLSLPVVLFGAGLPQLRARAGRAKSYAERLFEFPIIGQLDDKSARAAVSEPIRGEGVEIDPDALDEIVSRTQGYPYFLQEWGYSVWDVAEKSPITARDVEVCDQTALARLDQSFFLVRFDRLTPKEKNYLRAMAHLGAGPHRSGDVAEVLSQKAEQVAPLRNSLIKKGMIWSPAHGDTAFSVPLFDEFLLRVSPE